MVYTLSYNDNSQETYFQGGMRRLVDVHRYLRKHDVDLTFLGLQTASQRIFETKYIIPTASLLEGRGHYLKKSQITRLVFIAYYMLASIVEGSRVVSKNEIDAIESPQEDTLTPILAFCISKITRRPMIAIIHTIPCYGHLYGKNDVLKELQTLGVKSTKFSEIFRYLKAIGLSLPRSLISSVLYFTSFRIFSKSYVISVNSYVTNILKTMLASNNISTVYPGNGIELDNECPPVFRSFQAIMAGSLSPEKGIYDGLHAWKLVVDVIPQAKLAITGRAVDDQVANNIQDLVNKLELKSNVIILNDLSKGISHSQLLKYLSMSKILIYPSTKDIWPLTVNEAIGCLTPVILYDIPSFKNLFQNKAIIKVSSGSVNELADSIIDILTNDEKYSQALESSKIYRESLSWDAVALSEKKAYVQALRKFENQ
jgi:glycosyltransferase involved in cell wall biosynthesis